MTGYYVTSFNLLQYVVIFLYLFNVSGTTIVFVLLPNLSLEIKVIVTSNVRCFTVCHIVRTHGIR